MSGIATHLSIMVRIRPAVFVAEEEEEGEGERKKERKSDKIIIELHRP